MSVAGLAFRALSSSRGALGLPISHTAQTHRQSGNNREAAYELQFINPHVRAVSLRGVQGAKQSLT